MPLHGVPTGDGVTVPVPVLLAGSAICSRCRFVANVPVSERAWFIVNVQLVPVPLHSPLQPANVDETSGASVTVIDVPNGYTHWLPVQLIAAWLELVESVPVPTLTSVNVWLPAVNDAVTVRAWFIVTVHAPV